MARRETSTNGGGATAPGCTTETLDLHFQGRPHAIASFLLSGDGEAALIESGPGSTLTALMRGLAASGVEPELVTKILLTHIHLDHAGAAGELTELLPNAVVYVHGIGAPHLLDPSRLLRSADRIYGDQMDPLWGTMHPVPEKRLVVLEDGDVVEAAGRTLRAIYTPGHASHHVAFHDADAGVLFAGDVAGVRLPGLDRVMPPTPPPELNLELWSESINRMLALDLNTLYLTHYGPVHNVADHLDELHIRMYSWGELVLGGMRAGKSAEQLAADLEQRADDDLAATVRDPELRARFRLVSGNAMNVAGYLRYYTKRGER